MNRIKNILLILALSALPTITHAAQLTNPLGNIEDPQTLAIRILQIFLGFLSFIGLAMFIYGGFVMLTSAGNAERIKQAKTTLVWAAIGIITILGSYMFLQFVFKLIIK